MLAEAQTNTGYTTDVKDLYGSIQKLSSYKAQITGDKEAEYRRLYEHLLNERPVNDFDHFYKLAQLVVPLRDNHVYFSEVAAVELDMARFRDSAFTKQYRSSATFLNFPSVNTDLKVLEEKLNIKPQNSIEGIYYYGKKYMTVGVCRTAKKDSLIGVVLHTQFPNWRVGQIAFILKEYQHNRFRFYGSSLDTKIFYLLRNEKLMRGMLTESKWTKFPDKLDHVNIAYTEPTYQFKTLPGNIKYLRLGSFASNNEQVAISQKFFESMKDSLTSKQVIVDLRNNGGGGYKNSAKFINLLQHYALNGGKSYVIINNRTVSDAEQFTVRFKGSDGVITLGENTNGMIAYGNNTGRSDTLSSKKYRLYITDMRDQRNYVQYEDIGIAPDVYLDPDKDWIEQVLAYIKNQ
jgi:hypothetical protein